MKKKMICFGLILFFAFILNCRAGSNDTNIKIEYMDNTYTNLNILGKQFSNKQGYVFANNKIAYCVEPGIYILSDIYDSTPYFDVAKITKEQKEKMEQYAYYGYQYPNHQTRNYYLATQQLIWETLGMTDILFTTGLNRTGQVILVLREKEEILRLIDENAKKPSFDGKTIKLESGEKTIISDENYVLSQYQLKESYQGVEKIENELHINAYNPGNTILEFTKAIHQETSMIYKKENSQTLATFGLHHEITAKLNLNIEGYYLELTKKDEKTKGDAPIGRSLKGAVYEVKTKEGKLMDTLITDENGFTKSKELPASVYHIKEKIPSYGYLLDDKTYVLRLDKNMKIYKMVAYESPIEKTIELIKYREDIDLKQNILEPNITFEFMNKQTKETYTITTNENGTASISLPFGNYQVRQINTTEQYEKIKDFEIIINENSEEKVVYELLDKPEEGTIKLLKLGDTVNGEEISLENVVFELYRIFEDNQTLISTKKTDEEGKIIWEKLPFGNYCLKEIKTQDGYQLLKKDHCFELHGQEINKLEIKNELIKTELELTKVGEKMIKIENGIAQYESIPLRNVEFTLYRQSSKDEEILKLYSDDLGKIKLSHYLKPGRYYLKETNIPQEYQQENKKYFFTVDKLYQVHLEFDPIIHNIRKKGHIILEKKDENQLPLNNTTFALYDENNHLLYKETTDGSGKITIKQLPVGNYYLKEVKAKEGYLLKKEKIPVTIKNDEQVITLSIINKKETYPNTADYITETKKWIIGMTLLGCGLLLFGMILDRRK